MNPVETLQSTAEASSFQEVDDDSIPYSLIDRISYQKSNEKLDLSLCTLSFVPLSLIKKYRAGQQPRCLDLSFNELSYLSHEFAFDMVNLTRLDLSRNKLTRLPENFGLMRELVYLDLHQNLLETLPLSMGNMTRLQYLSITENPFRGPLRDFLGEKKRDSKQMSGVVAAELVIDFLRRFALQHKSSSDLPLDFITRKKSSRIHYRRRSCNIEVDLEEDSSSFDEHDSQTQTSEVDCNRNLIQSRRSVQITQNDFSYREYKSSSASGWDYAILLTVKTLIFICFWSILVPIFVAVLFDTSYLEHVTKQRGWSKFWNHYKQFNAPAQMIVNYFTPLRALVVRGPTAGEPATGIFQAIKNMLSSMYDYVQSYVTWIFK